MAKESMKAREVKRAKLVAKYAAKRAAEHSQECKSDPSSQSLQNYRSPQRLY